MAGNQGSSGGGPSFFGGVARAIGGFFGFGNKPEAPAASSAPKHAPPPVESPSPTKPTQSELDAPKSQSPSTDFLAGEPYSAFSSSNVRSATYNARENSMDIGFKNGGVYRYQDITPPEAKSFYSAGSKGKWVWDHLRVRGTVFGYQKPYTYIGGQSQGYIPKYAMSERHKAEHRTIGPEGMTPLKWREGHGPYHPEFGMPKATTPHPWGESPEEIETRQGRRQRPSAADQLAKAFEAEEIEKAKSHEAAKPKPSVRIHEPPKDEEPPAKKPPAPQVPSRKSSSWTSWAKRGASAIIGLGSLLGGFMQHKASGGEVAQMVGDGGDNEPIFATPGEHVTKKEQAQKPGNKKVLQAINSGYEFNPQQATTPTTEQQDQIAKPFTPQASGGDGGGLFSKVFDSIRKMGKFAPLIAALYGGTAGDVGTLVESLAAGSSYFDTKPIALKVAEAYERSRSRRRTENEQPEFQGDRIPGKTAFASGGFVPQNFGDGGDNEPIFATPGEHVTKKDQAQKPGNKQILQAINSGYDFGPTNNTGIQHYANGGFVQGIGGMIVGGGNASAFAGAAAGGPAGLAIMAGTMAMNKLKESADKLSDTFMRLVSMSMNPAGTISSQIAPFQSQVNAYNPAAIDRLNFALDNLSASVGRWFEPIITEARTFADDWNRINTEVGPMIRDTFAQVLPPIREILTTGVREFVGFLGYASRELGPLLRELVPPSREAGEIFRSFVTVGRTFIEEFKRTYDNFNRISQGLTGFSIIENVTDNLRIFAATLSAASETIQELMRNPAQQGFANTAPGVIANALGLTNQQTFLDRFNAAMIRMQSPAGSGPSAMTFAAQPARQIGIEEIGMEARRNAFSQGESIQERQLTVQGEIASTLRLIMNFLRTAAPNLASQLDQISQSFGLPGSM